MKKTLVLFFAATVSLVGISAAQAADGQQDTSTGQLTVKAMLREGCSINFGSGDSAVIDFGAVSALSNPMTQEGHFTVGCSELKGQTNVYKAASVSLDQGNAPGSTVENRLLSNGDSTLEFQVYQGSANTGNNVVWGDGKTTSAPVYPVSVSTGVSTTYDYHVSLLAQDLKDKTAGLYQNTMIATVNYMENGTSGT